LLGTDAASEGLNLQRLGTLINIDLPWNPTRLEQRKGRIQRIGQARSEIWIANLRYRGSVEDRVHQVLADRLEAIHGLFGQIPDTLEDVWVQVALNDEQAANQLIDRTTATRNPFRCEVQQGGGRRLGNLLSPKGAMREPIPEARPEKLELTNGSHHGRRQFAKFNALSSCVIPVGTRFHSTSSF
jgi:superfamily II DNA/RNA helicase